MKKKGIFIKMINVYIKSLTIKGYIKSDLKVKMCSIIIIIKEYKDTKMNEIQ